MGTKQYAAPLWRNEINQYLDYLRAGGHRPESVKTRSRQLVRVSNELNCSPIEVQSVELLRWFESKTWKNETRRSMRDALRLFFSWMQLMGLRDDNPAVLLPKVIRSSPAPHPCPDVFIAQALRTAPTNVRVMIRLAAECGLRRAEIAAVSAADVLATGSGYSLIVHGKGGKQRIVPIISDLADAIINAGGFMFPGRFGGHVEASYVGKRIGKFLPDGWSCHSLRHRYATRLYAETRDILLVSRMLGHEKVSTTQRYVASPMVDIEATLRAISV